MNDAGQWDEATSPGVYATTRVAAHRFVNQELRRDRERLVNRTSFRRASIATVLMVLIGLGGRASAHAVLAHAEPPAGGSVATSPKDIILEFSEAVEPRFSRITVQNAQRQRVDAGDVHVAPNDPKRLVVSVQPLPSGRYKVTWHVVSVDTHSTDGTYVFTVGP
jgi:methionine-rich copper-binding protein CopC